MASPAHAQPFWRTPPIKNTGNQAVVSCELLNNSGQTIRVQNLMIQVRSLESGTPVVVVSIPGAMALPDGRGIRGSAAAGSLPLRTLYCEIPAVTAMGSAPASMWCTMTMDDGSKKVVTVVIPPQP